MKYAITLATAVAIGLTGIGCEQKSTSVKKTEVTTQTPDGERKTTVEQKVETTPDSQTRTTTEKVETKP